MISPRFAQRLALGALLALIALGLAWELRLAPLRPGGSWAMLKVLPLLAPLRGLLHGRLYTFRWTTLLALAYVTEGVVRTWSDTGAARALAAVEVLLALTLFAAAALFVRASTRTN